MADSNVPLLTDQALYGVNERQLLEYNALLKRWLDANGCDDSCHRPTLQADVVQLQLDSQDRWHHFRQAIELALQSNGSPPPAKSFYEQGLKEEVSRVIEVRILDKDEGTQLGKSLARNFKDIYERKAYIRRIIFHATLILGRGANMFSFRRSQRWSDLEKEWQLLFENIDYHLSTTVQGILDEMKSTVSHNSTVEIPDHLRPRRELIQGEYSDMDMAVQYKLTNADRQSYDQMLNEWALSKKADGTWWRPFMKASSKNPKLLSRRTWEAFFGIVECSLADFEDAPKFETFRKRLTREQVDGLIEERALEDTEKKKMLAFTRTKWDVLVEENTQIRRIRLLVSLVLGSYYEVLSFRDGQALSALDRPWRVFLDNLEGRLTRLVVGAYSSDQVGDRLPLINQPPEKSSQMALRRGDDEYEKPVLCMALAIHESTAAETQNPICASERLDDLETTPSAPGDPRTGRSIDSSSNYTQQTDALGDVLVDPTDLPRVSSMRQDGSHSLCQTTNPIILFNIVNSSMARGAGAVAQSGAASTLMQKEITNTGNRIKK